VVWQIGQKATRLISLSCSHGCYPKHTSGQSGTSRKATRCGRVVLPFGYSPKYLADVAQIGGEIEAITHHNPKATVASRGCPVGCSFCIVPRMEGLNFTLIWDFIPRPILCDNNLSALPVEFQEHIIRRYQETGTPLMDANSGFEPRSFDEETYQRWKVINRGPWRFAFDEMAEAEDVQRMMIILKDEPAWTKRVYVLIGNEPIEACHERITKVIEWGGEPHCQPIMALNTLVKRPQIRHDWTEQKLHDMARWANRWLWRTMPISEYKPRRHESAPFDRLETIEDVERMLGLS